MTYNAGPAPVTRETLLIGQHMAYLIRSSPDEKWAIWSICKFLNHWQIEIKPEELASLYQPL